MSRFSQRRPNIAGKPLTDHSAKRHLLKLVDLIFTLPANPDSWCECAGGVICACVCASCISLLMDKQIYGRPDGSQGMRTEIRFNWHSAVLCLSK